MSWQKCPLCNGSGIDPNVTSFSTVPICSICKGAKIISELNGLPPVNVFTINTENLNFDFPEKKGPINFFKPAEPCESSEQAAWLCEQWIKHDELIKRDLDKQLEKEWFDKIEEEREKWRQNNSEKLCKMFNPKSLIPDIKVVNLKNDICQ